MVDHRVILMRGLPGTGKSTLAKQIEAGHLALGKSVRIVSSDNFFVCRKCDDYRFRLVLLPAAHQHCRDEFVRALKDGVDVVIVDNTNVTALECRFYVAWALNNRYGVEFREPPGPWPSNDVLARRNTHGVPLPAIDAMADNYVIGMTVDKALAAKEEAKPSHEDYRAVAGLAPKKTDIVRDMLDRLWANLPPVIDPTAPPPLDIASRPKNIGQTTASPSLSSLAYEAANVIDRLRVDLSAAKAEARSFAALAVERGNEIEKLRDQREAQGRAISDRDAALRVLRDKLEAAEKEVVRFRRSIDAHAAGKAAWEIDHLKRQMQSLGVVNDEQATIIRELDKKLNAIRSAAS